MHFKYKSFEYFCVQNILFWFEFYRKIELKIVFGSWFYRDHESSSYLLLMLSMGAEIIEIILMRYLQFWISSSNGTSVKGIRIKSKFKRLGLASIKIYTSFTYIRYQNRTINDQHHSIANISNLLYKFCVFFFITFHALNRLKFVIIISLYLFFFGIIQYE